MTMLTTKLNQIAFTLDHFLTPTRLKILAIILFLILPLSEAVVLFSGSEYHAVGGGVKGVDFLIFYNAGKFANQGAAVDAYDYRHMLISIRQQIGEPLPNPASLPNFATTWPIYLYSPPFTVIFALLARLPFWGALAIWLLAGLAALLLAIWLLRLALPYLQRQPYWLVAMLALGFWPLNIVFSNGQYSCFTLLVYVCAFYFTRPPNLDAIKPRPGSGEKSQTHTKLSPQRELGGKSQTPTKLSPQRGLGGKSCITDQLSPQRGLGEKSRSVINAEGELIAEHLPDHSEGAASPPQTPAGGFLHSGRGEGAASLPQTPAGGFLRGRDWLAGLIATILALQKPQLLIGLGLIWLLTWNWRAIGGLLVGTALACALTLIVLPPATFSAWIGNLLAFSSASPDAPIPPTDVTMRTLLHDLLPFAKGFANLLYYAYFIAALAALAFAVRRLNAAPISAVHRHYWLYTLAALFTVASANYLLIYDLTLLLLPVLLLFAIFDQPAEATLMRLKLLTAFLYLGLMVCHFVGLVGGPQLAVGVVFIYIGDLCLLFVQNIQADNHTVPEV